MPMCFLSRFRTVARSAVRGLSVTALALGASRTLALTLALTLAGPVAALASDDADKTSEKGNLPEPVEGAVSMLLDAVGDRNAAPGKGIDLPALRAMLDFAMQPAAATEKALPAKRDAGYGIFYRSTINAPLEKLLRYCYDPAIPQEAVFPASIRSSRWQPDSDIIRNGVRLWDHAADPGLADAPRVLHGAEREEITPDTFSGCYYAYTLNRLLVLTRHEGRAVLVSVSRQAEPSTVGRKGAIVGKDTDWEYVYSGVPGATTRGISWMDTYMYDSATVTVFFEEQPGSKNTGYALFKWVKAGWANLNVVQRKHIRSGAERFLSGFRQVLESDRLPPAETIAARTGEFDRMNEDALRTALSDYCVRLAVVGKEDSILSRDDFWKIIKDGAYANHLSRDELVSALLKNYMKERLGKPSLGS
ncbi:hypothetical protein ACR4XJ_04005 [Nitratidesulfovibrio sp. D1]|uniref:hypothetical protein n=1 Tax=Nitratidesulfovibrio sp. D1 TaxID=3440151 RepID=UPI003EBAC04A